MSHPSLIVFCIQVAHREGRFIHKDKNTSNTSDPLPPPVYYCDNDHQPTQQYPLNPNNSENGRAALLDRTGRHLALMPHPERAFIIGNGPGLMMDLKITRYYHIIQSHLVLGWNYFVDPQNYLGNLTHVVVGSGAREHAIVHSLAQSPEDTYVSVFPGNPGMELNNKTPSAVIKCYPDINSLASLQQWLDDEAPSGQISPSLVVFGPGNY